MLRAFLTVALILSGTIAGAEIVSARYETPTARYDHGVLGDALEWADLVMQTGDGRQFRLSLPENRVFEDIAPRLVDMPGAPPVVVTVETDLDKGARLALYRETGLVAATPFIGQPYRWLAPIGAADLDGDGRIEFAYVDRPHLAKIVRILRYDNETLTQVAELPGFSNHRIGEDTIAGGIRDCGDGPEMILADGNWRGLRALGWDGRSFAIRDLGGGIGRERFAAALACTLR